MKNYSVPLNDLLKRIDTDPKIGLNDKQVKERLSIYGENRLKEKRKKV